MGNAIRVKNLSKAEQELAPGTGFVPAGGHVDFPVETYKNKHERYTRARIEADPPILEVSEVDSPDVDKQARIDAQTTDDEQRGALTRQAELGRKIEETVQKSGVTAGPSTSGVDTGTPGRGAADEQRKADEQRRREEEQRKTEELQKQQNEGSQKRR
jgi:hypothetical protein